MAQYWLLGTNGERLGRIDLRFQHRFSKRVYFAFEAKRLHVVFPKGKYSSEDITYIGSDGMLAFVNETYAKGFSSGGMLGYVMDGKSDEALLALETRIAARRSELKL